jgi:hypothetical protein
MPRVILTATIPAGGTLSSSVDLSAGVASFLFMPNAWTLALLSFQASPDNVTFSDLVNYGGQEISIDVTPGTVIRSSEWIPANVGWLKFRSGSHSKPIAQEAARTFTISVDS